jgi:hypothetical protein
MRLSFYFGTNLLKGNNVSIKKTIAGKKVK